MQYWPRYKLREVRLSPHSTLLHGFIGKPYDYCASCCTESIAPIRMHCETIGNYWCQLRARDDQIKRLIDLPEGTSSMFSFFSVVVNPITWALVSEDLQRSVNIFGSEPFVSFVWTQKETQFEWKVFFSHWKYFDCQLTDHHLIYYSADKVVDVNLHVNFSWMMSK